MFTGREVELNSIRQALGKTNVSVLVYGKRKVGKTTLISRALSGSNDHTVYYECLKSTIKDNIDGFVSALVREKVLRVKMGFESFQDVFIYLNSLEKPMNIVIDEYPYLKQFENSDTVDSIFQNIIDNHIGNLRLFLSGSHVGMMKDLLLENNALYGRFSVTIKLAELNYIEAAEFYPQKSVYDKVALYSVFGGSPFVCEFLDGSKTLKENIVNTILNPLNPIHNYAEHLLISDFSISVTAERIFCAIANGRKKYGAIEEKLGMPANGLLSKQLKSLLELDVIAKTNPINRQTDNKKTAYEISDNLLRFYYAFVYKNKSALQVLGASAFYDAYIAPSILTFISHRFEDICRSYFSLLVKTGRMHGVSDIGTFYYDDSASKTNGEFDVVLARHDRYDIFETKFLSVPLDVKTMEAEERQIMAIPNLKISKIGFVSVSGFESTPDRFNCISGESLYKFR